jgi:hypothetical protein
MKEVWNDGYKVLNEYNGKFISFSFSDLKYGGMLYSLSKVTKRKSKNGPLCVFRTLKDVKKYFYPVLEFRI